MKLRRFSTQVKSAYDTVIVGGGPIGSSTALHLALRGHKNIVVIEKDGCYKKASCMLSAGGMRQQFSVPENIKMSCYGAEFLKNIKDLTIDQDVPDVQFHQNGYLFLGSQSEGLVNNNRTQRECGVDWVDLLKPSELSSKFPWLNVDGVTLGSFGSRNEGYFDPWSFVAAMKKKAISLGVHYIEAEVVKASLHPIGSQLAIQSVTIRGAGINTNSSSTSSCGTPVDGVTDIQCGTVVNAAGAWASQLMSLMTDGNQSPRTIATLPVRPRKRCIFTVHCPGTLSAQVPPSNTPLVIDPSGVYFRPEGKGNRFICGVSPSEDNDPDCTEADLDIVDHRLFEDIIWPALYERVPAFQELKVQSSWAGFYEYNTLDQNAIIGFHPDVKNLMLCNGFSGHGLQQGPAAGRAVSELLTSGKFETIDLKRFSFDRILNNTPIFETGIV